MIKKNLQYLLFSLLVIGSVSTSEAQLFKKKAKAKAPTEAKPKITAVISKTMSTGLELLYCSNKKLKI